MEVSTIIFEEQAAELGTEVVEYVDSALVDILHKHNIIARQPRVREEEVTSSLTSPMMS